MKVAIPQINLAALIARGGAVVAKNSPIDVLNNVRLIAGDGQLRLASSDQDRFAEGVIPAQVDEPGAITVDKLALEALVAKHPKNGVISMEIADARLVVTCGRSKVKLPTIPAEQFPAWADDAAEAEFTLDGADFERAFNRVRFAASSNPAQYYLQGVCLDAHDGKLHFAATDTHRLAVSGMVAPSGAEDCPRVVVPSEGVDAALKVFKGVGDLAIAVNAKSISFASESLRLACKLIDGNFPDYTRIIPARGKPALVVRRADFVDCLQRANVLAESSGQFSSIVARPDGESLRLESRNHKGGEADEQLDAVIGQGFRPFGFSPRYAAEFLATLNVGELSIEQSDPNTPHLIYSDDAPDFVGVLGTVRIAA